MKLWKIFFAAACLIVLSLIYWSSTLIEADVKTLRREIKELKAETAVLSQKVRNQKNTQSAATPSQSGTHTDARYPNLLVEDLYFTKTLPAKLGDQFQPKGILKEAIVGRPENLHPFNGFRDVSQMIDLCTGAVATLEFGKYETLAPEFAFKLEARPRSDLPEVSEYWVHLREDLYWQPLNAAHFPESLELAPIFLEKHRVTAHDFKFFYDAVMNPYISESKAASLRTYYSDIEEFRVIDDYTFVVRWKAYPAKNPENDTTFYKLKYTSLNLTGSLRPLASFVYQYFADGKKIVDDDSKPDTYRTNSVWAQNFAQHWAKNTIVSCGAYTFEEMNDESITFRRNPDYFNSYAALTDGIRYRFKENLDAVWQDFKTGKIDLCILSPNQLLELDSFLGSDEYKVQKANNKGIRILDYVSQSYFYIGWNETKNLFNSAKIRRALTLAIDRNRIIEQNLNDMAVEITGPFSLFSPAYDTSIKPWPFNPAQARQLLEEEGWIDTDGDGIRDKLVNGKREPFKFKLYYYVKSLTTKVIAEYIATALREVGIDSQISGVDIADLSRQFDDKSFDAIFMGWASGSPPEDPRQLWYSSGAKEKGSSNAIGFANKQIDQIIDSLNYEYDRATRIDLYHKFHKIIHELAPYTFLYTPKVRLIYREYVKNIFVPRENQDIIPEANISEPNTQVIWLEL